MIRAIYRWEVQPGAEETFITAWSHGTRAIRTWIKGAYGSVLIRNRQRPSEFIAVARWESLEDWQAFSIEDLLQLDSEAFERMAAVSTLVSTEVGEEVADLVIADAAPSLALAAAGGPSDGLQADATTANHQHFWRLYPGLLEACNSRPCVGLVGRDD